VKKETPVAAKNSAAGVTESKVTGIPAAQTSVTNETAGAKDPHCYLLGAAFIVMAVWLLVVSFGRLLIRRTG
jgi:disulfide bond formation protein DsbB